MDKVDLNDYEVGTFTYYARDVSELGFVNLTLRTASQIEDRQNGVRVLIVNDIYHTPVYKRRKDKDGNWSQWEYVCDLALEAKLNRIVDDEELRSAAMALIEILKRQLPHTPKKDAGSTKDTDRQTTNY